MPRFLAYRPCFRLQLNVFENYFPHFVLIDGAERELCRRSWATQAVGRSAQVRGWAGSCRAGTGRGRGGGGERQKDEGRDKVNINTDTDRKSSFHRFLA